VVLFGSGEVGYLLGKSQVAARARSAGAKPVTRIYATGKMSVSLTDASSRSGGLDVGVPKPVNLLSSALPANSTNTSEATLQNYTNGWNTLSQIVQVAGAAKDAAGNILPGGSLRLTAASARSVSMDEIFTPPIIFGYIGFDCAIAENANWECPYRSMQSRGSVNQCSAEQIRKKLLKKSGRPLPNSKRSAANISSLKAPICSTCPKHRTSWPSEP
jgi:hypothetical protein